MPFQTILWGGPSLLSRRLPNESHSLPEPRLLYPPLRPTASPARFTPMGNVTNFTHWDCPMGVPLLYIGDESPYRSVFDA